MQYRIDYIFRYLKIGMKVRTNGAGFGTIGGSGDRWIEGIIGEKDKGVFYVFNNIIEGRVGKKNPTECNFLYSWGIYSDNSDACIEFLDEEGKVIQLYLKCTICNKEKALFPNKILDAEREFKIINKEKLACRDCFNKYYISCGNCGRVVLTKNTITDPRGGKYTYRYCKKCYSDIFLECNGCKETFNRNDLNRMDYGNFCAHCFHVRFEACRVCGNYEWRENLIYNPIYDVNHCKRCKPHGDLIKEYGYMPNKFTFNKLYYEKGKELFMGMELEVEIVDGLDRRKIAEEFKYFLFSENINDMFYLKRDASIQNGFEIVTHPFTLEFSHKNIPWTKILDWLKNNHALSYEPGNCGLHVHVDRRFLNQWYNIAKLRLFFTVNKPYIYLFSERNGKGDKYCEYEKYNQYNFINAQQPGRHCAFNINSSKQTVEIRVFRGTLEHERVIAILQFCHASACFSKEIGYSFLVNSEQSWDYFLLWCKQKNIYNNFLNNIKKLEKSKCA